MRARFEMLSQNQLIKATAKMIFNPVKEQNMLPIRLD